MTTIVNLQRTSMLYYSPILMVNYGKVVVWNFIKELHVFYILLTVHLDVILVNDLLDALFFNVFISCLYMFRATSAHHQEDQLVSIHLCRPDPLLHPSLSSEPSALCSRGSLGLQSNRWDACGQSLLIWRNSGSPRVFNLYMRSLL
jgi:hypothetical protein